MYTVLFIVSLIMFGYLMYFYGKILNRAGRIL